MRRTIGFYRVLSIRRRQVCIALLFLAVVCAVIAVIVFLIMRGAGGAPEYSQNRPETDEVLGVLVAAQLVVVIGKHFAEPFGIFIGERKYPYHTITPYRAKKALNFLCCGRQNMR